MKDNPLDPSTLVFSRNQRPFSTAEISRVFSIHMDEGRLFFMLREISMLFSINYERSTFLFSEPEMPLLQLLQSTVKRENVQFRTEDRL